MSSLKSRLPHVRGPIPGVSPPRVRTRAFSAPPRVVPANDRVREGDEALAELWPMIQLVARRACRSAAESEDIAQIVALDAITAMDANSRLEPSLPWIETLIAAARRRERGRCAREAKLQEVLGEGPADDVDTSADPEAHMFAENVLARLSELSPEARHALQLVAVEGLSYREASARIGVPIGTLMSRLARARSQLSARCA